MTSATSASAPVVPRRSGSVLSPLGLNDVRLTGGFWADVQSVNRTAIIPHCDDSLERVGWVENFRAAVRGTLATDRVGRVFTDSEIYKTMEALAWEIGREDSPALRARLDDLAELVSAAQHADGYISTFYGYEGGPGRYSDMENGHELYCYGHLLQAAVAAMRSSGSDLLTSVAIRVADHICDTFGPNGLQTLCGHPEVETALVELYRETRDRRYLEQAKLFVDRRGHRILGDSMFGGRDYYQDDVPVRDADILVGHAVRALYLAAGAIDVAVETGDEDLLQSVRQQYDRTLERRTYLTGGMGSNHHGEAFGDDFELPSERAYAETCAAIASVHVAWRLLLATGESSYADIIERTLFNSVLSSPSADGRSFFYINTLHRRVPGVESEPGVPSLRRTDGTRAAWFTTSCCPTNTARLLSSLSCYVATSDDSGIQVHQYAHGVLTHAIGDNRVTLSLTTAYPKDDQTTIVIDEADGSEWTLSLRIPNWTTRALVEVNGSPVDVGVNATKITRAWQSGDVVRVDFDMTPRLTFPDSRIDALRGTVAVERGPLVYCLESPDQPDVDMDLVALDVTTPLTVSDPPVEIIDSVAVHGKGLISDAASARWPYFPSVPKSAQRQATGLTFVPYFRWANRGPSTMRVWLPVARSNG